MSDITLSDTQKKAIKGFCFEMSASMTRSEAEKTLQSEATKILSSEQGLEKSLLSKMSRIYHRSKFAEVKENNSELESVYQDVFGDDAI